MTCKHLDDSEKVTQKVEPLDGKWAINGCCGGGCLIIKGIVYCPFCGEKLVTEEEAELA